MGMTLEQFDSMVSSSVPMGHRVNLKKLQQRLCVLMLPATSQVSLSQLMVDFSELIQGGCQLCLSSWLVA